MPLPRVAIVGRPNVGKSSLLNRLARQRISIVDPTPGVTRDRVATVIEVDPPLQTPKGTPPRLVELIDTGGYGVYTAEGGRFDDAGADLADLTPAIEAQIGAAVAGAQLILFVVDAQAGLTALDHTIATMLRARGASERILVVANKVDGEAWTADGLEAAALGFGEPACVSAVNGHGLRDLTDVVHGRLEGVAVPDAAGDEADEMRIAIVGKRNAGKSTLVNALAGEPRVIVSEIAGTTRDAVDVRFEIEGRRFVAIDTAGVRKRKSFADDVEYYAYHRMLSAIRRADVVLFLVDATEKVSQVDKKLSQELQRQHKPTVLVVNKWDRVTDPGVTPEDYAEYLTTELRGLDYAPIALVSALEGEGLRDVVSMAFNLRRQALHREPTGRVNQLVRDILSRRGPSSRLGTQAKLYYAAQIDVDPPTIALVVNRPQLFEGRYERYLRNRLREELPFSEVPIRLVFSQRSRVGLQDLKEGRGGARAHGEDDPGDPAPDGDGPAAPQPVH